MSGWRLDECVTSELIQESNFRCLVVVLSWSLSPVCSSFMAGLRIFGSWFANFRLVVCESADPKMAEKILWVGPRWEWGIVRIEDFGSVTHD
jgi:hypothetical protein